MLPEAAEGTTECKEIAYPPAVYWTRDDVLSRKMIYMPTGRIARLLRVEPDGRLVMITPEGKILCEHGECSSTILSWIGAEKAARSKGEEPPPRKSACDCENTDGLYHSKSKPRPPDEELPPQPDSLYSFLSDNLSTHELKVAGRSMRHVPHTTGKKAMYLTQKGGNFVCKHAHSLVVLRKMRKARSAGTTGRFRGGMCDCELDGLPQRNGLKKLPKLAEMPGKYGWRIGVESQNNSCISNYEAV